MQPFILSVANGIMMEILFEMDMKGEKVIGTVVLDSIGNIGEEYLVEITKSLIEHDGVTTYKIPLEPSNKQVGFFRTSIFLLIYASSFLFRKNKYKIINYAYKIRLSKYFKNEIKKVNGIIYTIGMLKFSTQNFSYLFFLINSIATQYDIPVLFNAMSIEAPDNSDWRFHQLEAAINMPCVKMITTRDGISGLNRLRSSYIKRKEIDIDYVGDPGLFISEKYIVKKRRDSNLIGIGLIRKNIFSDYLKVPIDEESLYIAIIKELELRGYKWVMFCNGMSSDYALGQKILKRLNLSKEKLLPVPRSGQELVDIISGFNAVICARFHACMTAYSLFIPFVGFLWDDKLKFFAESLDIKPLFCDVNELDGVSIVNRLESVEKFKWRKDIGLFYKQKTNVAIRMFLSKYVVNKENK